MSIGQSSTPDHQMGGKVENEFDKYNTYSKERTPKEFNATTIIRLHELCSSHPTEADIKIGNVSGMDHERQKLQIDLLNILETIPSRGDTGLETEGLGLLRDKLASASGDTIVSIEGDHLNLDPQNSGNIYNRLASAHKKMNEALIIMRLLLDKKK